MKQEEKWKEAFSNIAIRETEELEKSLTYEERRKAEALYKRHRETALHLIRKQKGFLTKWTVGIAAAAAVFLILWGLSRPIPDTITPAAEPVSTVISATTSVPQQTASVTPVSQTIVPAPYIPKLESQLVDFPKDQRYAVYTGPGEHYERANNNKAVVSTNDWIQVFGVEQGYAMIQYAISSEQRRIGYINAAFLPENASVSALEFGYVPVIITQKAELTDDPLGKKIPLHTLQAGTEALLLAVMDDWEYVEWNGGEKPVRGFVPATAVQQENGK